MTVCAILTVLMGLVTITLVGSIGLGRGGHNHHEQLLALRRTIETFRRDVRASRQVVGELHGLGSGPDCLILRKPNETVVYQVQGLRLERRHGTQWQDSPADVLLRGAPRLEFRYNAPTPGQASLVVLDIGLRQRLPEKRQASESAIKRPAIFHYPVAVGFRGPRHAPQ